MGYTLTILGCGVMGQAILSAIYRAPKAINSSIASLYPSHIIACNHDDSSVKQVEDLVKEMGESPNGITVSVTHSRNNEAVSQSAVVLLGTKPYLAEKVLDGVSTEINDKLIISIVAGWTISQLQSYSKRVSRIMTNTPARYGYGCAVVSHSTETSSEDKILVKELIDRVGTCIELPERNMDAATSLVGSGPAFVLLMIESMTEAGIKMGIPFKESLQCATKVMEGTTKMLELSGQHPSVLKHQVCTPGGTTIAGLCAMEDRGVKSGLIHGFQEAADVAAKLGKK
ncbi:similar to Saccharomyces cerevisiae YER023W PRO3 Delta 1-pyrroline-5-carboxylate reductase, catalyzes the last step in proline biosynthesis [Maudiozyma barnettii]|uniref:Pyrroline-5-carboxylate reductase n=1 Tax=Maudiozyma barnettii TaxID=61262 RepID=A0A8H2ZGU6_9SACH|nr:pyrroline-5-carboxylate reductase [Kazachstania barnettii]CAB4254994.1 similar to Saccharomyces cerevisiae YER023W PRO3 Delta 1-pyrroline-5-carboxylate reductase, catalyzes the last step in proline biosynthesis [Kazachstania barnettii]CAD1783265.1 similar to Saccharomyces cerevisiae YER023W PRO3 Delta 1-pyrroline-5-carboxylate reductase, catalyzes the last step in proline biosynthesis [Kazachstania barnettii]